MRDEEKVARDLRAMAMENPEKVQRYAPNSDFGVQVFWKGTNLHLWIVRRGQWPHKIELRIWTAAFNVPLKACMTGPVNLGEWKGQTYEWNPRSEAQGQMRMAA